MESCKRYDAKVLILALPRAPQHSISTLTKVYTEKSHQSLNFSVLRFHPRSHLSEFSYACHVLNLKADLVACLHATGVPRQHLISAKTQMTCAIINFQSYELSYFNWETEWETRTKVLIFHSRVLRSPEILTFFPPASFLLPSFLLH